MDKRSFIMGFLVNTLLERGHVDLALPLGEICKKINMTMLTHAESVEAGEFSKYVADVIESKLQRGDFGQ